MTLTEVPQEMQAIFLLEENIAAVVAAENNVLRKARKIQATRSWHDGRNALIIAAAYKKMARIRGPS